MADSNVTTVKAEVIDGSSPRSGASGPKRRRVSWSMLLSGVLFLILGIVCWVWPNLALETIALILGIGFLVAGVGTVADYVLARGFFSAWLLVDGILDVILGIIFIVNPLVSAWALAWLVAIAIIVSGIMQLFSFAHHRCHHHRARHPDAGGSLHARPVAFDLCHRLRCGARGVCLQGAQDL